MKFSSGVLLVSTLCVSAVFAGPKAVFKSTTFDCGKVMEGKVDMLHAEFTVTNEGDKDLIISNVRPGCGCTNVKFDSTVAPGKSMTLKSDVNIKGYHSGSISKYITFTSNSTVDPTVKLIIQAEIISAVKVTENYIRLDSTAIKTPHVVDIFSLRKDLKISGVSFKVTPQDAKNSWQSDLPLEIKYKLHPCDSVSADSSSYRFKIEMFAPTIKGTLYGDFTFKTNNPEMKEVVVQGALLGGN
jgi:3-hydroxymyristoyl/3-hydroxydecanoyl-(acyl carrier protein) dehydratase